MNLNEKLVKLRKAKGLTQKELAEALNVTRQAISRWEVGTAAPSLDNLAFLSRLYGVPLDDFIQDGTMETEELSNAPASPEPAPANTGRPHVPLALPLILAVLILGVGILIGLMLRKPKEEIYLYPSNPGERITVGDWDGRLEKTPADIEDEKEYLGSNGPKKDCYSIYYPDSGVLKTFPNDSNSSKEMLTTP